MMQKGDHNEPKRWTAADFERYYKNNMPPGERNELEKAALEDPFLQDALEGYVYTHTPVEDVQMLKKKLQTGDKDKSIIVWHKQPAFRALWKVAAVLILFAGFAWIWFSKKHDNNKEDLAVLTQTTSEQTNGTISEEDTVADMPKAAELKERNEIATMEPPDKSVAEKNSRAPKEAPTQKNKNKNDKTELKNPGALDATIEPARSYITKPGLQTDSIEMISLGIANAARKTGDILHLEELKISDVERKNEIHGRVLDEAGMPVPYARIKSIKGNEVLSTDRDGYFAIENSGNKLNIHVDVNALGYQSAKAIIDRNSQENKIVLKETENLALAGRRPGSENQQGGIAADELAQKNVSAPMSVVKPILVMSNARPVDGWVKYNDHIRKLVRQEPAVDSARSVTLSFTVDANGKPVDIKVVSPSGSVADSIAVRILQKSLRLQAIDNSKPSSVVIPLN